MEQNVKIKIVSIHCIKYIYVLQKKQNKIYMFKGTVSVTSSEHPCKDETAQFTTVPVKDFLIKYELDIHVFFVYFYL